MMGKKIAVADSETDPFKEGRTNIRPFLWGYYDGETYEEFSETIDFIQFIYDKEIILYAHNGGKFDWLFIIEYIDPFTDITIINGRISKFKIGKCEFRDSYNILPTPLSAYQKTKIDYNIFEKSEREKPENKKAIANYLYDDCIDLFNYVSAFVDRFGNRLTLAGAAMKQWEQISGRPPPEDVGGVIYDAFSPFYYGGRCQSFVFGNIEKDFSMIDINSAYPYAMLSEHPISLEYIEISFDDWERLTPEKQSSCFLDIDAKSSGALPFRSKNGLFFPDDVETRNYTVTGWEVLAGLDTNTLKVYSYNRIYLFLETISFKPYVDKFYEEKAAAKAVGDVIAYLLAKLFLNTLYGKYGSDPRNYKNYQTVPPNTVGKNGTIDGENKWGNDCTWHYSGDFGSSVLVSADLDEDEQKFYNVATAASITGFVRAYLWRAICLSENPMYCDTDSIAAESFKGILNGYGTELGQWENEGDFIGGSFCGKKLYAMKYKDKEGHKIASKGVKLNAEELYRVASGEEITYNPLSPTFSIHKEPTITARRVNLSKKMLATSAPG